METALIVFAVAFSASAFLCVAAVLRSHGRMADRLVALASPASAEALGRLRGVSIPKGVEEKKPTDEIRPGDFELPMGMDKRFATDFNKDDGN